MKTHILILIGLILLNFSTGKAQNWAPEGAEWHYDFEAFWMTGYIHIQVAGDTAINDTTCRILNREIVIYNHITGVTDTGQIGNLYMASDEDHVFLYAYNKFYTLFDFSSETGDTWVIPGNENLGGDCGDEGELIVVETDLVNINGENLRKIIVQPTDSSTWGYGNGEIVERIGPIGDYLLPQPSMACGIADLFEGGPLRCYYDDSFGLYSTGYAEECDFTVGVQEAEQVKFKLFPNPCKDFLYINIPDLLPGQKLEIYDISGKLVREFFLTEETNQINVSALKPGIYSANILSGNSRASRVIVIQ
jgi:hypothetical protein